MLFELIIGIAALVAIVVLVAVVLRVMRREQEMDDEIKKRGQLGQTTGEFATGCAAVVGLGFVVLAFMAMHSIDAGHVGVVTSFGKVQEETLKPGLNFLPPFVYGVTDVDTRVHAIPFGQDPAAKFGAASKEYQDVFLQGTLNIHIDQNAAVALIQQVGLDYDQKLVVPFFTTAIKEVVPQYSINDILANREKIRQQTVVKLQDKLKPYGIVVDDVAISNIDFSDQYKQAVEQKQVAAQSVETEKNVLLQKQIQADEARAVAQGAADATLIQAQGQAKANLVLEQSLTPEFIQYQAIISLNPKAQVIYLPSGGNFILPLPGAQ